KEMRFPHSLGLLYSVFTAFLGFEVNEGEYKVMGMAPYGEPRYVDKVHRVLKIGADGSVCLDMDYFSFHRSPIQAFNGKFEELYVQPAAGDGGGAVGAALWAYHCILGKPRSFVMEHAYWGEAYGGEDARTAIAQYGLPAEQIGDEGRLVERVVDALAQGRVV